ncbi:glycosyltransferase family 2 protein [Coralliovum pocilloporae]|uniref:glycosyltransferase family 2 protein n=1 Tax=Coralliovum pocilloporae TaxID=3066369 RepID=UPI003306B2F5
MRHGHSIVALIPALNEAESISHVLRAMPRWVDQVIVVDNGSEDATASLARASGADVISEPRRGYGAACLRGLDAVQATDIILFTDADYSDDLEQAAELVDPVAKGDADLVIGARASGLAEPGALSPHQRFGNGLACLLIRRIWGSSVSDLGPFRAIRAETLRKLAMHDHGYGWTIEMQIKAIQHNLEILEIPVTYRRRIGTSKISGTVSGSLKAGYTILKVLFSLALKERFSQLSAKF